MKASYNIPGKILSKKNKYEIGNGRFYQNREVSDWMSGMAWELRSQRKDQITICVPVKLIVEIQADNRNDLDNQVVTVCDLLQMSGILKNDRLVREINAKKILAQSPHFGANITLEYGRDK